MQQALQTFPMVRGAVTHDGIQARYCLDLEHLLPQDAQVAISLVKDTLELVLNQVRQSP